MVESNEFDGVLQPGVTAIRGAAKKFVPPRGIRAYEVGHEVIETQAGLPLGDVVIQEFIGPINHHLKPFGAVRFPVDLLIYIAEEVGVVQTAPPGIGATHRHAGVVHRSNQLGTVLGHFGFELRSGHGERDGIFRCEIVDLHQKPPNLRRVLGRGFRGGLPTGFPLPDVIFVDLGLPVGALGQKFPVLGIKFQHQGGQYPEHLVGRPARTRNSLVSDERVQHVLNLHGYSGCQCYRRHS